MFLLFNDYQQVWKICQAGGIITPCTSRRPSLLVKRLCYTERRKVTSIPTSAEISAEDRNWRVSFQMKHSAVCHLSNSRGLVNEDLSSFIYWWLFWWTDCNRFVGQELMTLLISCTKGEWFRYRLGLGRHVQSGNLWLTDFMYYACNHPDLYNCQQEVDQ